LDIIIANDVSDGKAFGQDDNAVTMIDRALNVTTTPLMSKDALAHEIVVTVNNSCNFNIVN